MKKVTLFTVSSVLIVVLFTACSTSKLSNSPISQQSITVTADKPNSTNIKFEYFYRGFVTLHDNNDVYTYPSGTLIIQTDEDWHDFMDKYVPGIPYYTEVDYSKDCLVFNGIFPAKPFYSIGADIQSFVVNGNKLEPEYVENGPTGMANGIYAQNIEGIMHCFVNIVKVSKNDIPKGIKNVYHKKQ